MSLRTQSFSIFSPHHPQILDLLSLSSLPHSHKMVSTTSSIQDRKKGHTSLPISFNQGVVIHKSLPAPSSLPPEFHWPDWDTPLNQSLVRVDRIACVGLDQPCFHLLVPDWIHFLEHVAPTPTKSGSTEGWCHVGNWPYQPQVILLSPRKPQA